MGLFGAFDEVLAAYVLIDFATGLYHFATDKGFNHPHQVALFMDHHETNTMQGFDWQPSVASLPAVLVGAWIGSVFLTAVGIFGVLAQVPHYFAHHPPRGGPIRWAQQAGLIISPEHHAIHHDGKFDRDFCIFTGWCNPLLNWIVGVR